MGCRQQTTAESLLTLGKKKSKCIEFNIISLIIINYSLLQLKTSITEISYAEAVRVFLTSFT